METINSSKITELNKIFDNATDIVLTAHTKPDADAVGSCVAMSRYLNEIKGKKVRTVFADPVPETIDFVLREEDRQRLTVFKSARDTALEAILRCDLIICLDCNSFDRTSDLEMPFRKSTAVKVLIDHHLNPATEDFNLVFSTPDISSSCELEYYILKEMPEIGGDAKNLPATAADALLTGMTTDTNNFSNSVFPTTFTMASELMAAGVNRDLILGRLYNEYRENRVRFMGYMLKDNLVITEEGAAFMIADNDMLEKYDIHEGETEAFVNIPLAIGKVRISIFLKQDEGFFRVSARSKEDVSANAFATRFFHGGGHEHAAGGRLFFPSDIETPDKAASFLRKAITDFFSGQE
ncbi:MAG: DHH family phosphoesterase [Bacteroidales bacterium]